MPNEYQEREVAAFRSSYGRSLVLAACALVNGKPRELVAEAFAGEGDDTSLDLRVIRHQRADSKAALDRCLTAGAYMPTVLPGLRLQRIAVEEEWSVELPPY